MCVCIVYNMTGLHLVVKHAMLVKVFLNQDSWPTVALIKTKKKYYKIK